MASRGELGLPVLTVRRYVLALYWTELVMTPADRFVLQIQVFRSNGEGLLYGGRWRKFGNVGL